MVPSFKFAEYLFVLFNHSSFSLSSMFFAAFIIAYLLKCLIDKFDHLRKEKTAGLLHFLNIQLSLCMTKSLLVSLRVKCGPSLSLHSSDYYLFQLLLCSTSASICSATLVQIEP